MTIEEENIKLRQDNEKLVSALSNIISSCVHPEIAVRCVMLDLKPIRKVLKETCGSNKSLGIT